MNKQRTIIPLLAGLSLILLMCSCKDKDHDYHSVTEKIEAESKNYHGVSVSSEPYFDNIEMARPYFIRLRELRDDLLSSFPNLKQLSMGMSGDFEVAIEEGATIIRVGSAIFGERH